MIIVCAWCTVKLGEVEPLHDEAVSHGICVPCRARVLQEALAMKVRRVSVIKGDGT